VDDLSEGGSFEFKASYTYNVGCPLTAACGSTSELICASQTRFNDQCFSYIPTDPRQGPLYLWESVVNTAFLHSAGTPASTLTLPNDVQEGYGNAFSATLCMTPYYERYYPVGFDYNCPNGYHQIKYTLAPGYHLNFSSLANVSGATPGISSGVYQLPSIVATPRGTCYGATQTITPTVQEFCAQGTTPGYILIKFGRIHTADCGPGAYYETMQIPCMDLPLFMDCHPDSTAYCPSVPMNYGFDDMNFSFEYICDPGCNTCSSNIACASASTYHHCHGICDAYFSTDNDFLFTRQTPGYDNGNYDCSNPLQPLTVTTQPAIDLQAAYPGDKVNVTVSGEFSGTHAGYTTHTGNDYNSIFLQVRHNDLPATDRADFRLFDIDTYPNPGKGITITDLSGSPVSTFTVLPADVIYTCTLAGGVVQMNLGLSPAGLGFMSDPTHHYKLAANIDLIARTSPSVAGANTFYKYGYYPLTRLRAEFMGIPTVPASLSDTLEGSCDSWGTYFTMMQPGTSVGFGIENSTCDEYIVKYNIQSKPAKWSLSHSDFPHEFKTYAVLDPDVTITIPPGYQYISTSYVNSGEPVSTSPSAINGFATSPDFLPGVPVTPSNVSGNTATGYTITYHGLTGTGTSCWPLMDLDYFLFYSQAGIFVKMQPTCTAPSPGQFTFQGSYTESTNQDDPLYASYQLHQNFNLSQTASHINPHLSLSPPNATVNALTNTVSFDFELCNGNPAAANQPWIAVENSTVNGLNLATATAQILPTGPTLTTSAYTDSYGHTALLINFPSGIPVSACRQIRITTTVNLNGCVTGSDAVTDFIMVKYGNECSGALIASPDSSCVQDSIPFSFVRYPSDLLLTADVLPAAPVNLCDGVLHYDLTITSSEIGSVTNPQFWMNLPAGITLQDITFSYPCGTTTYTSTTADATTFGTSASLPGWNLNPHFTAINTSGLPGNSGANSKVCVSVNLLTNCSYNATDYIYFYAGGVSSCSQQLTPTPIQHRPVINDVTPADNLGIALSNDASSALGCNNVATYSVTVTNNGTSANTHNNVITVNLPTGPYVINPGSGALASNTITWNMPVGSLNAASSATYTFSISLGGTLYCTETPATITASFSYNQNVNCTSTGGLCAVAYNSPPVTTTFTACCQCQLGISITSSNAICNGTASGSATANISGAGLPVSYLWSNGQTTATATGLVAGTYTVTATDANNCTITGTITITEPAATIITISPVSASVCQGSSTTLCASGATSYIWSDGSVTSCISVSPSATSSYTVTGTDVNGCVSSATTTVTVVSLPVVTVSPNPVSVCSGGSRTLCASGASTYTWSTGSMVSCITVSPLASTTYTVTGSSNGCNSVPATATVNVLPLPPLCMSPSQTICSGGCATIGGSCTGTPDPGVIYSWSSSAGLSYDPSPVITDCPAATTTYTLSAINTGTGCSNTGTVSITVVPTPTITVSPLTQTVCAGTTVTVCASGATTYQWSTGATTACVSATPANPGTRTVTVTGYNGNCAGAPVTVTVTVLPAPVLCMSPSQTICSGSCVTISGKCDKAQHATYSWSPSAGLSNPTSVTTVACPTVTTTYTLTATDPASGCSISGTVTVNVTPTPTVTVSLPGQSVCAGNAAIICASGATAYSWSNGSTSACITVTPTATTTYTVIGYNGSCAGAPVTATVTVLPVPVLCMSANQTICSGAGATISGRCHGIPAGTTYSWSPTPSGPSTSITTTVTPTVTTVYTLTATNASGCSAQGTVTITVVPTPTIIVSPLTQTVCAGATVSVCAGGASTYQWSNGSTTSCLLATPTNPGTHTISVTGYNGACASAPVTATITILPAPVLCMSGSQTICSGGSASISGRCHGIPAGATYSWSPAISVSPSNSVTTTATPTVTTVYTLTATNTSGCSSQGTVTVTVVPTPTITVSPLTQTICVGTTATICASGATTYQWNTGASTVTTTTNCISATPVNPGTRTVTVTGYNGTCASAPVTATVTVVKLPQIRITGPALVICNTLHTYSVTPVITSPPTAYSWTATHATPSSGTGTTANIQFTSPGGVITWTATQGSCVSTATYTVLCNGGLPSRYGGEEQPPTGHQINVFPNPNDGNFTIEYSLDGNGPGSVIIVDLLGKVISSCDLMDAEGKIELHTHDLPNGTYIYKFISGGATLETGKIVIMK
jgi:hypothetical protein